MPFWISLVVAVIGCLVSAGLGCLLIPLLKKLNFGQTILEIGPRWHKAKEGTPTMGGFMFIISTLVAVTVGYFIWSNQSKDILSLSTNGLLKLVVGLAFALFNGAIGFIDDYIKVVKKRNLGLTSKQKLILQFIAAGIYLGALYLLGDSTTIWLPILGQVDFGLFYYPLIAMMIVYIVNAVNIADGVDGLCGTLTVIAALCLTFICTMLMESEMSLFAMALAGGCLGYLVWNFYPAKVLMGDTGSLFIGGAIIAIGMATRQHIALILVSLVYILEALSVVIQVISFKTTGKRIFKMSPIHHHFELCKWSEYKIVVVFSLVGLLGGAGAILLVMGM